MNKKNIVTVCFLSTLGCFVLYARPFSQTTTTKNAVEFDHSTVLVRDLQKSTEFYVKVFGLERISEPFNDGRHVWFRVGTHEQLHVVGGAKEPMQQGIDVH